MIPLFLLSLLSWGSSSLTLFVKSIVYTCVIFIYFYSGNRSSIWKLFTRLLRSPFSINILLYFALQAILSKDVSNLLRYLDSIAALIFLVLLLAAQKTIRFSSIAKNIFWLYTLFTLIEVICFGTYDISIREFGLHFPAVNPNQYGFISSTLVVAFFYLKKPYYLCVALFYFFISGSLAFQLSILQIALSILIDSLIPFKHAVFKIIPLIYLAVTSLFVFGKYILEYLINFTTLSGRLNIWLQYQDSYNSLESFLFGTRFSDALPFIEEKFELLKIHNSPIFIQHNSGFIAIVILICVVSFFVRLPVRYSLGHGSMTLYTSLFILLMNRSFLSESFVFFRYEFALMSILVYLPLRDRLVTSVR